jgi:hypothetical protein
VVLNPGGIELAQTASDVDGAISLSLTLPLDLKPGAYSVALVGLDATEAWDAVAITVTGASGPAVPKAANDGPVPARGQGPGLALAVLALTAAAGTMATRRAQRR